MEQTHTYSRRKNYTEIERERRRRKSRESEREAGERIDTEEEG